MAINFDRLGLSGDQQALVDAEFLTVALDMFNGCRSYTDMAWRTQRGVGTELEAIHTRVFDQAHIDISSSAETHPIRPIVIESLAKLSFIDTLALPSSDELGVLEARKMPEGFVVKYNSYRYRRLFAGLINSDSHIR